jgi:phage terminase small subunit
MSNLTLKRRRFVAKYLVDLNATQAAIRAGYSQKTANRIASELLSKPDIREAVAAGADRKLRKAEIKADQVLAQIRDIAFGDIRTLFGEDGTLIPLQNLSDEAAALIASFEVEGMSTKRVRIMDRLRALELLAKNLGLLKDQVDHHHQGTVTVIEPRQLKAMSTEEIAEAVRLHRKVLELTA